MRFCRRRFGKVLLSLTTLFLAFLGFWEYVLPQLVSFDETRLEDEFPATIFYDRYGNLLHTESGKDYAIRFPVSLDSLPPHLIEIVLAAEDRRFFEHDGVDFRAAIRAGWQLLTNGRIVSGASTVTMQLVAIVEGRERSFLRKFGQMAKARNLERKWSKQKILEEYFNRLPYGGKIFGIEAAAQCYFGKPACDLNFEESVMLAGIPQRPNRYRPDRFLSAAFKRRDRILQMLVKQGVLSPEKAELIRRKELRFRDFSQKKFLRAENPQFFYWVRKQNPSIRGKCITTLDTKLQPMTEESVRRALSENKFVRDGAAIVIENKTRSVRAFVGTADFNKPGDGQVNAATSRRSPGSLLKPFIYGEAIDGGLIVAETLLEDAPLKLADYRPGNFSGTFAGKVSARSALAKSLNTPAVRLLSELGVERSYRMLNAFGFDFPENRAPETIGLSLAIGGAETTLWNIAASYSTLANGGVPAPLKCIENKTTIPASSSLWSAGTAEMILDMLQTTSLPGAENLAAAWKTGTSNGFRDAWCVAVTKEWTVAVWFGNKDGSGSPELVGAEIAAPVAGKILSALYRDCIPERQAAGLHFTPIRLCAESGLGAGLFCREARTGSAVVGVPLRRCTKCKLGDGKSGGVSRETKILEPRGGIYRSGGNGIARIFLKTAPGRAHWYLDGNYLGFFASGKMLEIPSGRHTLVAWHGENFSSDKISFEVK